MTWAKAEALAWAPASIDGERSTTAGTICGRQVSTHPTRTVKRLAWLARVRRSGTAGIRRAEGYCRIDGTRYALRRFDARVHTKKRYHRRRLVVSNR